MKLTNLFSRPCRAAAALSLFFCALAAPLFAQDDPKNPALELPSFVITGSQNFTFPASPKMKPELISTLSEEFISPVYTPEQLDIRSYADPVKPVIEVADSIDFFRGKVFLAGGNIFTPTGEFRMIFPLGNTVLSTNVSGFYRQPFIDYAGAYQAAGNFNLLHTVDHLSGFFGGGQIDFGLGGSGTNYKLYGSQISPRSDRLAIFGDAHFGFSNLIDKQFKYSLRIEDEYFSQKTDYGGNPPAVVPEFKLTENFLNASASLDYSFSDFNIITNGTFLLRTYDQAANSQSKAVFKGTALAGINQMNQTIQIQAGAEFVLTGEMSKIHPQARLLMNLGNGLSIMGEYAPSTVFITSRSLTESNPYYTPDNAGFVFYHKDIAFNAAAKFEYLRFFEVNGGISYFSSGSYPYYVETQPGSGEYSLAVAGMNSFSAFLNFLFYPGPAGDFFGSVKLNVSQEDAGKYLPYHPVLESSVLYGYRFLQKFRVEAGGTFYSGIYTDIANQNQLNSYIDFKLKLYYYLQERFIVSLEGANLAFSENYLFQNYKNPGVSVLLGVRYLIK